MREGVATEVVALLILGGAVWLGLAGSGPPAVVPATAPPAVFSAERAVEQLRPITRAPHPTGSPESARIATHLAERLTALGLTDVHSQRATGFNTLGGWPHGALVTNIVGRKRGNHNSRAVLLMAHYDAVPGSFGAGDDGSGVAAILETLRALQNAPSLANDLIVVFTDAEEAGLIGAEAFVDLHQWAKDVGVVLNFDARGVSGPSYMYQTSRGNGGLIRALAATVPGARANSLMGDVANELPNDTDFSVWMHSDLEVQGLNFAPIGGLLHYHTPIDNLESLDLRTLQHQGNYALGMVQAAGHMDLERLHGPDEVYFDAPGLGLVHYPVQWAAPLAWLLAVLLGLFLFFAVGRNEIRWAGVGWGAFALLMSLVLAGTIAYGGWALIGRLHPGYRLIPQGEPYNAGTYFAAFGVMTAIIVIAIQRALLRTWTALELSVIPMILLTILNILASRSFVGATYLLTWPLAAAIAAGVWTFAKHPIRLALPLFALPGIVLWVPLLASLRVALTAQAMPELMVALAFVLLLLAVPLHVEKYQWESALPLMGLVAIALVVRAETTSGFTAEKKQPDRLFYLMDGDSGKGTWVSFDRATDAWTSQVLGSTPVRRSLAQYHIGNPGSTALVADAAVGPVAPAQLQVVESQQASDGRRVHLRLGSGGALRVMLHIQDSTVLVSNVVINGRVLKDGEGDPYSPTWHLGSDGMILAFYGVPADGIELWMTVHAEHPTPFLFQVIRAGLPSVKGAPLAPRPPLLMSGAAGVYTDVTIVEKRFVM